MKKIKILEVVPSLQEGGIEHFLYNYLSNLDLNKFDITILTQYPRFYKCEKKFIDLKINILAIPSKKQNIFKYFIYSYNIMKKNKYNILHCHLSAKSFWMLYIAKIAGVKSRFCHSHEAPNYKGIKIILYKLYAKLSMKYATCYLACGAKAAQFVFGNNKNVIIIPNSIDVKKFEFNKYSREVIREKYSISKNTFCIGNVGRLSKVKNQKFLILLLAKLIYMKFDIVLIILGDGPYKKKLIEIAKKLKVSGRVHLIGNVNNPNDYYSAMDCFILSSFSEGFPVSGIEAQASGLPCFFSKNITKEIALTNCQYYSLENISEWIDIIDFKIADIKRIENNNIVDKSIYNIKVGVKILENVYENGVKNEKIS